jgi:hypothetical protein
MYYLLDTVALGGKLMKIEISVPMKFIGNEKKM